MGAVETVEGGAPARLFLIQLTLTPAAVNTITAAEQTFTCPGIPTVGAFFVTKPTAQAGIATCHARRSAANQVGITWVNPTAGNVTPTAGENYVVGGFTPTV